MRIRFGNIFNRSGHESDFWPVALLLIATAAPALCVLWFMNVAVQNQSLATKQLLGDFYRSQLFGAQLKLDAYAQNLVNDIRRITNDPPARAFANAVRSARIDSVIIRDSAGEVAYPNVATVVPVELGDAETAWQRASRLEFRDKDFRSAATAYEKLSATSNAVLQARALQAQARCLAQAGEFPAQVLRKISDSAALDNSVDSQGRLIVASAELMFLESKLDLEIAVRLRDRLNDYGNPALAASQRRFLMKELQRIWPEAEFPTLPAEELAASFFEEGRGAVAFSSHDQRVTVLCGAEKLRESLRSLVSPVELSDAGGEPTNAFLSVAAGQSLPGWKLSVAATPNLLQPPNARSFYGAVAAASIGLMLSLGFLAVRSIRKQAALARLRNDLAATVSHELKTPLASMRVLLDTLLDSENLNEKITREYLHLISVENDRLGRVIQNFLSFSRLQRGKWNFDFAPVPPERVAKSAAEAMRARLPANFKLQLGPNLPSIMADENALSAALSNLLDNACKFTGDEKEINLSVASSDGTVRFTVTDNGIGIAKSQQEKIFRPFHQVDTRLSRARDGCGLGLHIARRIVENHRGELSVESDENRGSKFSIILPACAPS